MFQPEPLTARSLGTYEFLEALLGLTLISRLFVAFRRSSPAFSSSEHSPFDCQFTSGFGLSGLRPLRFPITPHILQELLKIAICKTTAVIFRIRFQGGLGSRRVFAIAGAGALSV